MCIRDSRNTSYASWLWGPLAAGLDEEAEIEKPPDPDQTSSLASADQIPLLSLIHI